MNDPIYRCKCCGQLVNPERNKVCPSCKCELFGNMTKDTSRPVKEKPVKYRKPLSFWKIVGIVALVWFLWNIVMPIIITLIIALPLSNASKQQAKELNLDMTGITNDVTKNGAYPFEVKKYFAYSDKINFNDNIKKKVLPTTVKNGDRELLEFTLAKYENGDIWLRGSGRTLFVPIEKIIIGDEKCLYLVLIDGATGYSSLPNSSDLYVNGMMNFTKTEYFAKKKEMYESLSERMLSGNEIDAILVKEETDKSISFYNLTFTYNFDEYKTIKTADGIVYETKDGERHSSFIEIPHTLNLNQYKTAGTTILRTEVEVK